MFSGYNDQVEQQRLPHGQRRPAGAGVHAGLRARLGRWVGAGEVLSGRARQGDVRQKQPPARPAATSTPGEFYSKFIFQSSR